jgi:hypothetical protein
VYEKQGDIQMVPWTRKLEVAAKPDETRADVLALVDPEESINAPDLAMYIQMQANWPQLGFVISKSEKVFETQDRGDVPTDNLGGIIPATAPAPVEPPLDPGFYYRLTTQSQGDGMSLGILTDGVNNRPMIFSTKNFEGQFWRVAPQGNGLNRLTTQFQGEGKSLGVLIDGLNNNQPLLFPTSIFPAQFWTLTPLGNGFYRLTNQQMGEAKSLEAVKDANNNIQLILASTSNSSGQLWKLTRTNVAVSAAPPKGC